jgi:hypothetical protein
MDNISKNHSVLMSIGLLRKVLGMNSWLYYYIYYCYHCLTQRPL